MTFKISQASDYHFEDTKTFTTIEYLKEYIETVNPKCKSCVIYFDSLELIIYDDWIE